MASKAQTASKIVQNPRLWPTSFTKPVTSQQTCIRNYLFKNGTKVEKFLDFVKKTLPNSKVELKKNNDGSTSVSLTTTSQNQANNDESIACLTNCIINCIADGWVSSNLCSRYCLTYVCKRGP